MTNKWTKFSERPETEIVRLNDYEKRDFVWKWKGKFGISRVSDAPNWMARRGELIGYGDTQWEAQTNLGYLTGEEQ